MSHAKCAPSAAQRWLACPASIRLCAEIPPTTGPAAERGTAIHAFAAWALEHPTQELSTYEGWWLTETGQLQRGAGTYRVTGQMIADVRVYCHTIQADRTHYGPTTRCAVERALRHPQLPTVWGTADALVLVPGVRLIVYDLKTGRHSVAATDNPQLLTYATLAALQLTQPVIDVELVIVQPRSDAPVVRRAEYPSAYLWETWLPRLQQAIIRVEDPTTPPTGGAHCQWCPARAVCPAAPTPGPTKPAQEGFVPWELLQHRE